MIFNSSKCWAAPAGNCSDSITREHIISKNFFSGIVTVSGLHWCKDPPKSVGMGSLTSKILCKYHNNALSVYDTEAGRLFHFLTEVVENTNPQKNYADSELTFNGLYLERWMVKTALNILFYRNTERNRRVNLRYLLPTLFEGRKFDSPYGLQAFKNPGLNVKGRHRIQFAPLINEINNEVIGGIFDFRGLKFSLNIPSIDGLPAETTIKIEKNLPEWHNLQGFAQPTQINIIDLATKKTIRPIRFSW